LVEPVSQNKRDLVASLTDLGINAVHRYFLSNF
jgi:hypothetical protein